MAKLTKASDSPPAAEPAGPARRSFARRLLRAIVWSAVALLVAAAGLVWLAGRPETLAWAARHASRLTDGRLSVEGVTGSLLRELTARSVRWRDGQVEITLEAPTIAYQPLALLDGRVVVEYASASRVTVDLPAAASPESAPALRLPPALAAMMPVTIHWLELGEVEIRRPGSGPVTLHGLEAALRHDGDRFRVDPLRLDVAAGGRLVTVRGDAATLARAPYATDGRFTVQLPARGEPLRLDVRLNGPLQALAVRASTVFAGAPLEARTVLHAFESRSMRQVRLEMKDLDLSRVDPTLPVTRLTGTYEAEVLPAWASEHKPLLIGPLSLANAIAGPMDRNRLPIAAAKAVVGYSDGRVRVQNLQASGPMGSLAGEGWSALGAAVAQGELPRFHLALASEDLRLRGIDSRLARRTLKARLAVDPAAGDDGRPAGSASTAPALPARGPARLRFEASDATLSADVQAVLAGHRLRIDRARIAAAGRGGGQANASGEVGLAAPFPVALAGDFRDFDPHRLLDMPAGRLNGTWRANGSLDDDGGGLLRVEAALADSRLRGLALSGRAAAALALEGSVLRRVSDVALRFAWGASTVAASGSLGADDDDLRLAIAAPKAGEIDATLAGAIDVQATLRGSLLAPSVRAGIDARRVSVVHEGLRADVATAAIEIASDRPRSGVAHVKARLDGVDLSRAGVDQPSVLRLDRVTADVAGSLGQHAAELRARGKDQRLLLVARGGLGSDGAWRGTVDQLEASHPLLRMPGGIAAADIASRPPADSAGLASLQPFTLEAGRDRIQVRDARFGFQGAGIDVSAADWHDTSLALRADASGVPARWLARFIDLRAFYGAGGDAAAAPAATGGQDLRLAAAVDFRGDLGDASAADWHGTLRLARESGDVALAAPDGGPPLAAGLRTLAASATIDARVVRMVLDIGGDDIGRIGLQAQATLQPGDDPAWSPPAFARSPLTGRLDVATSSLRWISPLAGDNWRIDGELSAQLRLAGTLGQPRADGVVTGAGLTAREPVMGMQLANGVLAAEFSGDRVDVKVLRFESGEGSVAVSGLLQSPGIGRSEARVVLDRLPVALGPKQRVVLSGSTVATLRERTLAVSGRLVAEEGIIVLDTGGAPAPAGNVEFVHRESTGLGSRDPVPTPDGIDREAVRKTGVAADAAGTVRPQPFGIDTDVELDLGRHFRVSGDGLDARLQGAIRVRGDPPLAPQATGTVELVDGSYRVRGRRLTISHGRVVFDGPPGNPALDIVAVRDNLKTKPGLAITGSAAVPVVDLVGEPGLVDAGRLPRLVLGAGPEAVPAAQHQAAALGARLGARLFDAYEQSLRGVWNILRLQYEITDRLSLGVQAGRERAADLLGFMPN